MRNENYKTAELENEPISNLLASLKRVEAPNDFDFRVKARIASRQSAPKASWVPAFVKVVVPAGVLVAGGYFGFNAFYPVQQNQQPTVSMAGMNPAPVEPSAKQPDQVVVPENTAPVQTERAAVKQPDTAAKKLVSNTGSSKKQPEDRSYTETLGIGRQPLKVTNQNRPIPKASASVTLSQIGISAVNSGSAVTIGSVSAGSVAERSGLKAGDVIESMDAKSIRIRRDGKTMQIELKP
jgi:hypothetical protein